MTAPLPFDLDNTPAETDTPHCEAFKARLGEHGVAVASRTDQDRILGKADAAIALDMLPHVAVERHAAIMDGQEVACRAMRGALDPVRRCSTGRRRPGSGAAW